MDSAEKIKLHTLSGKFNLSDTSFGIQSINQDMQKSKQVHQSNPHRHDSYFIKYIIEGNGIHNIDFVDYEVKPYSIFLMAPGQVHSFDMQNVKGFIIYFKTGIVGIKDLPFFNRSYDTPALYFDHEPEYINDIFHLLSEEYLHRNFAKNELIKAQLQSLLIFLTRRYLEHKSKPLNLPKRVEIIRKLDNLINTHFIRQRNVVFYSNALNISSRQLNNILNENLEKSISTLIHERILVEAKRLLSYTDKTISEIAYELNFNDKTYFHKFFKANENLTPEAFREKISAGNLDISE
ncbi:MAG: helix-turn-helix transcriptional regulator [Eubacteriales bacterium]